MSKFRLSYFILSFLSIALFVSCGGDEKAGGNGSTGGNMKTTGIDPMKDVGIGPIKELTLPSSLDQLMVEKGKTVYKEKCTACHKPTKKFIGPAPKGIFERRNPAWVMNMILNPEEMVQKNETAKKLLMEFNGSPMANQNLTKEEARAVLEYFRTL